MGLTPLAGVLMGTRCGDIDPSVVTYMEQKLGIPRPGNGRLPEQEMRPAGRFRRFQRQARRDERRRRGQRARQAGHRHAERIRSRSTWVPTPPLWAGWTAWCSPAASARTTTACAPAMCENMGFLGISVDPAEECKLRALRHHGHQRQRQPREGAGRLHQRRTDDRPRHQGCWWKHAADAAFSFDKTEAPCRISDMLPL